MQRLPLVLRELSVRVAIIAILSALLVPLTQRDAPQAAAPTYLVKDLGTFGTVQSAHANDLNDKGQVVGQAASRAFLWNGSLNKLPSIAGAGASGLNESGQVVGAAAISTTAGSGSHAVLWQNGAVTDLTPDLPASQSASASAINEGGQVVGTFHYSAAFLWQNGSRISLGHLGGGASGANDINDVGQVVGGSYTTDLTPLGFMQHPFLWQNGTMTDLGLLPGDEDGAAVAINNAGQIVGSSGRTDPETYESTYRAFLYQNGVMTVLPVPSFEAHVGDINDSGVVVGTMRAGGGFSKHHAWIYKDGVVTNLNSLIPAGTGLHLAYANAINNAGQVAGVAYDSQGRYHAFLLTPAAAGMSFVSIGDTSVTEGNSGSRPATFTVALSPPSSQRVTVAYSTANRNAAAGVDYQATSGTLTFNPGETSKTVSVLVIGDRTGEPDDQFYVNLSNATGGAEFSDMQGVGTILNDDRLR